MDLIIWIISWVIWTFIAGVLTWLFRFNIWYILWFIFYKIYPNISGEYYVYIFKETWWDDLEPEIDYDEGSILYYINSINRTNSDTIKTLENIRLEFAPDMFYKVKIHQFLNQIKWTTYIVNKWKITEDEKLSWEVKASRSLMLNYENLNEQHHNIWWYLLKITNSWDIIYWVQSFLCTDCGNPDFIYVYFKKIH